MAMASRTGDPGAKPPREAVVVRGLCGGGMQKLVWGGLEEASREGIMAAMASRREGSADREC